MKAFAIDIKYSVFNNDTEAIMYVIKDNEVEPQEYIFSIPVITFSWSAVSEEDVKFDFYNVFGDKDKEKRLLNEMKKAIRTIEEDNFLAFFP